MKKAIYILVVLMLNSLWSSAQGSLSSGLVLYLPFNGNTLDMSGYGNHASNYGATLANDASGTANRAYEFNGSSSYMKILNSASLQVDSQISLCAKVYVKGFYNGTCYNNSIIDKSSTSDYVYGWYTLRFTGSTTSCYTPDTNKQNYTGYFYTSSISAPLKSNTPHVTVSSGWDCLVFTYDGDTARMYVNGILRHKYKGGIIGKNTYNVFLGHKDNTTYPYWFKGVMDEVRIYNRALSDSEVFAYCSFTAPANTINANFKDSATGCLIRQFTDLSTVSSTGINLWFWNFGDGGTSTLKNPSHKYSGPGTYNVKLIVVDSNGFTDTVEKSISMSGLGAYRFADAGADTVVCKSSSTTTITLHAKGGISYSWSPSSGLSNPSIANPTATISSPTSYTVTISDSTGCIDKDTINIGWRIVSADAGTDTIVCKNPGATVINLNAKGGVSYSWTPPSGLSNPTIANPTASITSPINYTVTVTDSLGCTGKDTINISFDTGFANAGKDTSACLKSGLANITLNASGGVAYLWSPSSGLSNPNIANPIASYATPVSYIVSVTNARGCKENDTVHLDIYRFATSIEDTTLCLEAGKAKITLSASGGTIYSWSPADGLSDTNISNPTATISTNKLYIVKVTDANGCEDEDSVMLYIDPINVIASPKLVEACKGKKVQVKATGASNYEWQPSTDFDNYLLAEPILTVTSNKQYIVKGVSPKGCVDYDTIEVNLSAASQIVASPKLVEGCPGDQVQLNVSGGESYRWFPPSGLSNDAIYNPVLTISSNYDYSVSSTDKDGCTSADTVHVIVYPKPDITISTDKQKVNCSNNIITLIATGADSLTWYPAIYCENHQSATTKVYPPRTTTFTVTGKNEYGCTDEASIEVVVESETVVKVPNAFTPNNDNINDRIRPIIVCDFELTTFMIYNRWGQQVFISNDPNYGWDGTSDGKNCAMGTYYYLLKGKNNKGDEVILKGDITLIR